MRTRAEWSLGICVLVGVLVAVGLSLLAVLGIALSFAVHTSGVEMEPIAMREFAVGLPLVFLGYIAAGVVGGAGFWLLHPLRRSVIGWVLTGMLIAAAAYGLVGLSAVLGYVHLGVNMLGFESVDQAWRSLPIITAALSLLAGVPGGLYYWWKARQT